MRSTEPPGPGRLNEAMGRTALWTSSKAGGFPRWSSGGRHRGLRTLLLTRAADAATSQFGTSILGEIRISFAIRT